MATIPGKSGTKYQYTQHNSTSTLPSGAGNYAFMRTDTQGGWELIYAGESENIRNRVKQNLEGYTDQSECINNQNPSEIWVNENHMGKAERCAEEADILAEQYSYCNN